MPYLTATKTMGRPRKTKEELTHDLAVTEIFMRNKNSKAQIVIDRGGARSGKSYSIAQLVLERFFSVPSYRILVIRKTLPALRVSTLTLFHDLLDKMMMHKFVKEEKVAMNFIYPGSKSIIHFSGLDNPEKIKSTDWNMIWMEEATEFEYDDFMILKTRLSSPVKSGLRNQVFISFNPISEYHWIKQKVLMGCEDAEEIVSNYKNNPFLDEDYINTLENLIKEDINHYRIYSLGEWGNLENIIYSNWDQIDHFPSDDSVNNIFYGLDFGYNNPTALIKILEQDKELFEEELIYKPHLTTQDLIDQMFRLIPSSHRRGCKIYCDSAEPDRIEELKRVGFRAVPCKKVKNSVKDGIDFVKTKKIHISKNSPNLIKEKSAYSWKKIFSEGKTIIIDEPVKFNDHLMDAERYAIFTHLHTGVGPRIRLVA